MHKFKFVFALTVGLCLLAGLSTPSLLAECIGSDPAFIQDSKPIEDMSSVKASRKVFLDMFISDFREARSDSTDASDGGKEDGLRQVETVRSGVVSEKVTTSVPTPRTSADNKLRLDTAGARLAPADKATTTRPPGENEKPQPKL